MRTKRFFANSAFALLAAMIMVGVAQAKTVKP